MRNPHDRKLFLAGASGVIGRRLVPLLLQRGWHVVGTTRSSEKAKALAAAGAEPVVVDVFDARAIERAIAHAQPALVLHELTDLPPGLLTATRAGGANKAILRDTRGEAAIRSPPPSFRSLRRWRYGSPGWV